LAQLIKETEGFFLRNIHMTFGLMNYSRRQALGGGRIKTLLEQDSTGPEKP
jgi:hypothetical protein